MPHNLFKILNISVLNIFCVRFLPKKDATRGGQDGVTWGGEECVFGAGGCHHSQVTLSFPRSKPAPAPAERPLLDRPRVTPSQALGSEPSHPPCRLALQTVEDPRAALWGKGRGPGRPSEAHTWVCSADVSGVCRWNPELPFWASFPPGIPSPTPPPVPPPPERPQGSHRP